MDILKLIVQTFNLLFNSLSQFPFYLFIILLIIGYHITLSLIRDNKYVKSVQKLQISNIISSEKLTSKPLISFIVPAWKEDQTLNKTLNAILNLSYPNYKVIINAGGNEETIRIANSFKKYNNFTILNQKQGRGKITAINDAINQVSDGIIFLMDADVQVNDNLILNMIDPIINANEVVVTAGLKPHESIRNKDLVKFLYIDRNPRFRKKPVRYGDIIGIVTAIKYEVIQNINEFTVAKLSDDGRVIGKDLKKKNYKIYRIVELSGETYNFPEKISDFIPQQLRWMENAYYRRIEEGKKLFLLKKFLTTLLSIYLLIIPFLAFNINLIVIGLYILLFIYIKKIRKLIFFKKSEPSSIEINFNIVFYIKLIFYIYVEALLNVIVAIETIFFKDKYKKRKNIS